MKNYENPTPRKPILLRLLIATAAALLIGGLAGPASATQPTASRSDENPVLEPAQTFQQTESVTRNSSGRSAHSSEMATTVISSYLLPGDNPPAARAANTSQECGVDSSYSFQVCFTQHYNVYSQPGMDDAISVDKYTARWTRLDPSQLLQVSDGRIRAAVSGSCELNCSQSFWFTNQDFTVSSITMGSTYTGTPNWAGEYIQTSTNGAYQCGNVKATVTRYSSSWDFYSGTICKGSLFNPF